MRRQFRAYGLPLPGDLAGFGMGFSVHGSYFVGILFDLRQFVEHIAVVYVHDVVDEKREVPFVKRERRRFTAAFRLTQGLFERRQVDPLLAANFGQRPLASAAEVDPEFAKDRRGSIIGGDPFADGAWFCDLQVSHGRKFL